ncbi:MAG TPA: discoidin domain-containing protein, partial [Bacteroidales bacterium]|nr:discoidin domain-containing protein [Bacteroidales bacterium]
QIFDTTTGNGGIDKITFTHRAARYVRITCTSRATEWGYSLFEVEVYQSNLALNRPVAVSSTEAGFGNIASNINDSLKTTRWSSSYTNAQWLTIDLQQIYTIDRMQILWEAAYGSQYTIAISTDSIIWNIIYTESAGNGDEDTVSVSDNPARYVRWQGIQRATDFGYSIFEFEVYGKKHVALQPVTQTIALQKGWNLISVSVVDSVGGANAINRIFMGMDVNIVKNADGFWKPNQPEQLNSLQYIEPGKGYLVYMNAAENLTISGIPCRGELLFVPTPISNYFNTTNCNMIKNFDGFWVPNGAINSIENFESGKGYFLKK